MRSTAAEQQSVMRPKNPFARPFAAMRLMGDRILKKFKYLPVHQEYAFALAIK